MNHVFHKGEYLPDIQAAITKDNRAFRFADGFFESMRVIMASRYF